MGQCGFPVMRRRRDHYDSTIGYAYGRGMHKLPAVRDKPGSEEHACQPVHPPVPRIASIGQRVVCRSRSAPIQTGELPGTANGSDPGPRHVAKDKPATLLDNQLWAIPQSIGVR